MKASIIIPTFNALHFTKQCLDSIRLTTRFPHEIIIVDNGSTDGTREFIDTQKDIRLIKSDSNLGYAGACNLGIKNSDSKYIVISNNDILFTPNWLSHLIETSEISDEVGLVGPVTNHASGFHRQPHKSYTTNLDLFREAARIRMKNKGNFMFVPVLIFFCTLIKRKTVEQIGILDPNLGLGGCDDLDYSFRARMAGIQLILDLSVFVHHFCSKTYTSNDLNYINLLQESRDRYNKKWEGISSAGRPLNI